MVGIPGRVDPEPRASPSREGGLQGRRVANPGCPQEALGSSTVTDGSEVEARTSLTTVGGDDALWPSRQLGRLAARGKSGNEDAPSDGRSVVEKLTLPLLSLASTDAFSVTVVPIVIDSVTATPSWCSANGWG